MANQAGNVSKVPRDAPRRRIFFILLASLAVLVVGAGCGSTSDPAPDAPSQAEAAAASECDPNYTGACLNPDSSDYDCEGGSGNGPDYTGTVGVVGEDHYGLDADGDGTGCEPY